MKKIIFLTLGVLLFAGCSLPSYDDNYDMGEPFITTEQPTYIFDCAETEVAIRILSNLWWDISISYPEDEDEFITDFALLSTPNGPRDVTFHLEPNRTSSVRSATITVSPKLKDVTADHVFYLTQAPDAPWATIESDNIIEGTLLLGKIEDDCSIDMVSNVDWSIDNSGAQWLTFVPSSGTGNIKVTTTITCEYSTNASPDTERHGNIRFVSDGNVLYTVPVSQDYTFRSSELTITDNDNDFIASWTPVAGAAVYTVQIMDKEDAVIDELTIPPTTINYNLGAYFTDNPYFDAVKIAVIAISKGAVASSTSNVELSHPFFAAGSGDGSEGSEYLIANMRHLKNINATGQLAQNYKQAADLDFTGQTVDTYNPVGRAAATAFTGTYSGAKPGGGVYKMTNASFDINNASINLWGIFGYIQSADLDHVAKVEYLELENCKLTLTNVANGEDNPFAHLVARSNGGKIQHVTMTDCEIELPVASTANITIGTVLGYNGVNGDAFGEVAYCTTGGGHITYIGTPANPNAQSRNVGGIVGGGTTGASIRHCANLSTPVKSRGRAGGIAGRNCSVYNSYNLAEVECAVNSGGGIIALFNAGGPYVIEDCYNTGSVSQLVNNAASFVGGIVGRVNANAVIQRCFNSGKVTVAIINPSMAGGIAGDFADGASVNGSSMSNCFNTGDVLSHSDAGTAGGVLGNKLGASNMVTITNCYNTGNVGYPDAMKTSSRSGLAGNSLAGLTITNCYYLAGCAVHDRVADGAATIIGSGSKSSTELSNPATYGSWEDFSSIWEILPGNYPYPQLKGMPYQQ